MTTEAALTKLMFLLGTNLENSIIKIKVTENLAGELTI